MFAKIVAGLCHLKKVKSLIYRHNEFGEKAAEAMKPLLNKFLPHNIDLLRLEHCRTSDHAFGSLINTLISDGVMGNLSLIGFTFNKVNSEVFNKYLGTRKYLKELDLSSCKMVPGQALSLLQVISTNKIMKLNALKLANI